MRSRDRYMPEEINRLVTDAIADVLWTPSADADENLVNEGVDERPNIDLIGNIMIDSFEMMREKISAHPVPARNSVSSENGFALVTLHRPSNVDEAAPLGQYRRLRWSSVSEQHPSSVRRAPAHA